METEPASVSQTSQDLAVTSARPPTSLDQTATEVSEVSHLDDVIRCDVSVMKAHLCVHPQRVRVSTVSVTTVQTPTVAVKWTPVFPVSPAASVSAGPWRAACTCSSVTHTQTVTSAVEPLGEFTCITGAQLTPVSTARVCVCAGVSVNLVTKATGSPVWRQTRVLRLSEEAAALT